MAVIDDPSPKESQAHHGHGNQEAHFAEIADAYVHSRREIPATRDYHRYWNQTLHDMISPQFGADTKYYDPMCGACLFLDIPLDRFAQVYVSDLSQDMLNYILPEDKARVAYIDKQDVRELTFESNTFDVILIRGGLHHVSNDLEAVVKELYRVLKPGGQFIFSEPADFCFITHTIRDQMYKKSGVFEADEERGLTVDEIKTLCAKTGFVNLTYEPFAHLFYCLIGNTDFFPGLGFIKNPLLIKAMIAFDELSRKTPLWNQLCWIGNFSCYKPE